VIAASAGAPPANAPTAAVPPLTAADLAAWSDPAGWTVHPGRYQVLVGASSADARLSAFVDVN